MADSPLRVITLGGFGEIGKNLLALEYENDILIIDAGLMFPESDMLGIDLVYPDITYLTQRADRLQAIVLTHGHEDHIGALPYLLKYLDVPVYATALTRGLAEITRLGVAMGGRPETFAGLTGMGDLIATCTSPLSRNRHVGVELGKGRHIDAIIADMHMVAEGVKSAPTVMALADRHGIAMPIARDVFDVTQGKRTAQDVFRGLLKSSVGDEAHPG